MNKIIITVLLLVCLASAVRMARPRRCPNGSAGFCRGGKCSAGSYCSDIKRGPRRLCCRHKKVIPAVRCPWGVYPGICGGKNGIPCSRGTCKTPKGVVDGIGKCCRPRSAYPTTPVCRYGSTGQSCIPNGSGLRCAPGSSCKVAMDIVIGLGTCCYDRPKPTPKNCRDLGLTQSGICGTIRGLGCSKGYTCMFKDPRISDADGKCCSIKKPSGICLGLSTGPCGDKGPACRKGSTCTYPEGLPYGKPKFGQCCLDKYEPRDRGPLCPWGSTGTCGVKGPACMKGSTCRYPKGLPASGPRFGQCCRDRPIINPPGKRECKDLGMTQNGICGTIAGLNCPKGSGCMFKDPRIADGDGKCCVLKKPVRLCPWGSTGTCGVKGPACIKGSTCRYPKGLPASGPKFGQCCRDKPIIKPPRECKDLGMKQNGICGTIAGLACPKDSNCMFKHPLIADGAGKCCVMRKPPVPPKGVCPPPSGKPGPCIFNPKVNCLGDKFCGKGELCCSEGCNRVCKKAIKPPIKPPGVCPPSKPSIGICRINLKGNCINDKSCGKGELCCSDGCNRVCKKAVKPPIKPPGICPLARPRLGICVFNPKTNCLDDAECGKGELCCNDGCNSVCKKAIKPPIKPPGIHVCPPARPRFGICVFDPKTNCLDDAVCGKGELCCNDGCNRVCKKAIKPPIKPPVPTSGECPPAPPKIGICRFDPKINCIHDNFCGKGELCCSDGCNRVCKKAVRPVIKPPEVCPPPPPRVGICRFDPQKNCINNEACGKGELCCSDGCNRVCKKAISLFKLPVV